MIGAWSLLSNFRVLQAMCETDLDFLILDLEHGQYSANRVQDFVTHAKHSHVPITLRTGDLTDASLQKLIDSNPEAIQLAGIRDLAILTDLASRLSLLGYSPWTARRIPKSLPKVAFQIEFGSVWDQFKDLKAVPKVYVASFLGRYDMSQSLGYELKSKSDYEVCFKFVEQCKKLGIEAWLIALDVEDYKVIEQLGVERISLGSDISRLRRSPLS